MTIGRRRLWTRLRLTSRDVRDVVDESTAALVICLGTDSDIDPAGLGTYKADPAALQALGGLLLRLRNLQTLCCSQAAEPCPWLPLYAVAHRLRELPRLRELELMSTAKTPVMRFPVGLGVSGRLRRLRVCVSALEGPGVWEVEPMPELQELTVEVSEYLVWPRGLRLPALRRLELDIGGVDIDGAVDELGSLTSLEEVRIISMHAEILSADVLQQVCGLPRLRRLDLMGYVPEADADTAALPDMTALTELRLLSWYAAQDIPTLALLSKATAVRTLVLDSDPVELTAGPLARAVGAMPRLEHLQVGFCGECGDDDFDEYDMNVSPEDRRKGWALALAAGMLSGRPQRQLRSLVLRRAALGVPGLQALARAVAADPPRALERLDLNHVAFSESDAGALEDDDDGTEAALKNKKDFARALQATLARLPGLTALDIGCNDMSAADLELQVPCIRAMPGLRELRGA